MPDVIKDGSFDDFVNNQLKWKKFYCFECGCRFNANKHEYKYIWYKFGYYSMCPTCSSKVREYNEDIFAYYL